MTNNIISSYHTLAILGAAIMATSCQKNEQQESPTPEQQINFSITVQQGASWDTSTSPNHNTKTLITTTDLPHSAAGVVHNIGLFFTKNGSVTPKTGYDNMTMEATAKSTGSTPAATYTYRFKHSGQTTFVDKFIYKQDEPSFTLWGYYPRVEGGVTSESVPLSLANMNANDLQDPMVTDVAVVNTGMALSFKHILALLEFNIKSRNYSTITPKVTKVEIFDDHYIFSDATFNPFDRAVYKKVGSNIIGQKITCNYTPTPLNDITYTTFKVTVPPLLTLPAGYNPATEPLGGINIVFTLNNGTTSKFILKKEYLTNQATLDANKIYAFNLILDGLAQGTLEVLGWSNTGDISTDIGQKTKGLSTPLR